MLVATQTGRVRMQGQLDGTALPELGGIRRRRVGPSGNVGRLGVHRAAGGGDTHRVRAGGDHAGGAGNIEEGSAKKARIQSSGTFRARVRTTAGGLGSWLCRRAGECGRVD